MKGTDQSKETLTQGNPPGSRKTIGDNGGMSSNYEKKVFSTWCLWPNCISNVKTEQGHI